jgi:hypothetical protein
MFPCNIRCMSKPDHRIQIGVKLPPHLIHRIDDYLSSLPVKATRTAVIEAAITCMLDQERPLKVPLRTASAPPDPKPMKRPP